MSILKYAAGVPVVAAVVAAAEWRVELRECSSKHCRTK